MLPIVRWMEVNGHDANKYLRKNDLGYWYFLEPEDPIPVLNGISVLRDLSDDYGPNIGSRIVDEASVLELAFIGRVALGARTPAEALTRVSMALPLHSSHEDIEIVRSATGITVRETFRMPIDDIGLHAVHVLFCSMVQQLCLFTAAGRSALASIALQPHPDLGIRHIEAVFGSKVAASKDRSLSILIPRAIADAPFRTIAKDRLPKLQQATIRPLTEDPTLAGSIRPVVSAMMHGEQPSIERVAKAGGMSVRTLQRQLAVEGTTFSEQLEIVRVRHAKSLLLEDKASLSDISERLGYSRQSALTRAVRRWTGSAPSKVRQTGVF